MKEKLSPYQKGRIITILSHYFYKFLDDEKAIAGNKLYTFSTNAKRILKKDLIGEKLTKADLRFKEEYRIKGFE